MVKYEIKWKRKIKYFLKQTKYFIVRYHSTIRVAHDILKQII